MNRNMMIKKGTFIGTNGGVVEKIVSEVKQTDLGEQIVRKVVIKEPYLDERGHLKYRLLEMNMPGAAFE